MDYHGPRDKKRRTKRQHRSSIERGRTYKRRYRIEFYDPDGTEHGLPTYPWKMAPAHLYTRRQLLTLNLRPAQPVQAQILWAHGDTVRVAYLYDLHAAKPKLIPTLPQLHALERAWAARRTCTRCGTEQSYTIPTSLGCCLDCAAPIHHPNVPVTAA